MEKVTKQAVEEQEQLAELSDEEAEQVHGAGLLSSPLSQRVQPKGVWVREVVEDVEAY